MAILTFLLLILCGTHTALGSTADSTEAEPAAGIVVMMDTTLVPTEMDTLIVLEAHPQDSPINKGFLIITSDGENQLRIRGSIRVNGAYDLQGLQTQNFFDTYEIPVGTTSTDGRFFMQATQTRLGVEARTNTELGQAFMRVEGEFLGEGNSFHLRHAYGTLSAFTLGQTWTTFSDVSALPPTVDFEGPNSSISTRTAQIRFTPQKRRYSLALESPETDANLPDSVSTFQSFPDFAFRLRWNRLRSHMQFSGIVRSISVKQAGETAEKVGLGGLFTGRQELSDNQRIFWSIVGGSAISRYIAALSGRGLDVILNPTTGEVETIISAGGYLTYGQDWSPDWSSNLTIGVVYVNNKSFQEPSAFRNSIYGSGNLFWNLTPGTRLGLEYTIGQRVNKDKQSGTASRMSFIMYYDF